MILNLNESLMNYYKNIKMIKNRQFLCFKFFNVDNNLGLIIIDL